MRGVDDRGARFLKVGEVEPNSFQRPARRAVPTGEPAPHVLVGIDKEMDAALVGLLGHGHQVVEVGLIVDARPSVLDSLPGDKETQERHAPLPQPGEMLVCFFQGKGTPDKGDVAVIKELAADVGCAVRR